MQWCQKFVLAIKSRPDEWILITLMHRIDVNKTLRMAKGQVHQLKVKENMHSNIEKNHWKQFLCYYSWTDYWIFIKLIQRIVINRMLKVTQCQRQNVKIKYVICDKLGRDLYSLEILKKMFVILMTFHTI